LLITIRFGDLPRYERTIAEPGNADWLLRRGLWMVVQVREAALPSFLPSFLLRHFCHLNNAIISKTGSEQL
jgi:hypothetical protein